MVLGTRKPSQRVTMAELTFHLLPLKIQPTVYVRHIRNTNSFENRNKLSRLGREVNPGRRNNFFLTVNTLTHCPGTILRLTIAEICINELKITSAKPTVMEWPKETQSKKGQLRIWIFTDKGCKYSLTQSTGKIFFSYSQVTSERWLSRLPENTKIGP